VRAAAVHKNRYRGKPPEDRLIIRFRIFILQKKEHCVKATNCATLNLTMAERLRHVKI
jgi:hypothetical protein